MIQYGDEPKGDPGDYMYRVTYQDGNVKEFNADGYYVRGTVVVFTRNGSDGDTTPVDGIREISEVQGTSTGRGKLTTHKEVEKKDGSES